MKHRYDIVVIGAGPAGSVAAYAASRRGADVLLVDKASFPRYKVCGCCINAKALAVLDRLGLGGVLAGVHARPITDLKVYFDKYCANIGLSGGVSVSRSYLDQALINSAIEAGVEFSDRTLAQVKPVSDHRRGVSLRVSGVGTHLASASVVIIADGLAGTALGDDECLRTHVVRGSRMGAGVVLRDAPSFYEAGTIYMACGPLGYVGLVRLEDGSLDVAAALIPGHTRDLGGPGKAAKLLLAASGLPEIYGLADSAWRGTPALTRSPERLHGERIFLLGDAAGYIEPFTGEGIAWAVAGSEALTDLALAGVQNWHPDLGIAWEKRHHTLIRRQQIGCRVLASVMRRPGVARLLIRLLSRSPQLSRPFVRLVTQPLPA